MKLKKISNFLDKKYIESLQKEFLSNTFPWFFLNFKVFENDGNFQYIHLFYNEDRVNSNYFNLLNPFLDLLDIKSLVKLKLNLTPRDSIFKKYDFHKDVKFDCNTAIFYLNTNNGKTIFEDGEEIESEENKLIIFPSKLKHTGTTTTDKPYRMVLNINYF